MADRLKIGFVIDDSLDKPDGVQQYVLILGAWLSGQGHEVHYLAGQTSRRDLDRLHSLGRNVAVRFNGNRLTMPLPASRRRIRRLLLAERFDVLHVQMPYSPLLAHRIIMAAPAGTVIAGTFHILPHNRLVARATRLLGWWLRPSLRRFDLAYAVSPAALAFARRSLPVAGMSVLPNVVDLAAYQPQAAGPATSPAPASPRIPTILFLGRLVPRKGCDTFIRAIAELHRTYQGTFKAAVYGEGPLAAELQQLARQLGVAGLVEFAGFVPEADKAAVLAAADIAAYPSTGGESFGIVLIEAMAAGQAAASRIGGSKADRLAGRAPGPGSGPVVLAAANPGYASVLGPAPAQLFTPAAHRELAAAIAHFLQDATAATAARHWQQAYVQQFDVAVVGRRLLAAYRAHLRKQARP